MRINNKKLKEKLTEWNKKPKMSKKTERKVKRNVRKFRKLQREHHKNMMSPLTLALENDMEQQRIMREVEAGETEVEEGA